MTKKKCKLSTQKKTSNIWPSWFSYGMHIMSILEKIDLVLMELCCIRDYIVEKTGVMSQRTRPTWLLIQFKFHLTMQFTWYWSSRIVLCEAVTLYETYSRTHKRHLISCPETLNQWWNIIIIPLWPCEAMWWHRSRSSLAQVMSQCLFIKGVLCHSPDNFSTVFRAVSEENLIKMISIRTVLMSGWQCMHLVLGHNAS